MATPETAMKLVCYGPWRAASLLWQPGPGAWALTVACHAVFELAPKESAIFGKPPPLDPVADDDDRAFVEPWGSPAPLKASPEVIVVGHAHAPPGTQVTSLVARLAVGDLEKLIHVYGDCWFTQNGALSAPLPFTKMPLRWDRAAGGPHETNPAGVVMGKEAVADAQGRVLVPNLRPMGTRLMRRAELFPPVGFGPIRPTWPSRAEWLRHHAASWDPQRWAEQPLPGDVDLSYFNVAPIDQTLATLTGDEPILLEHLHPRFPKLTTQLAASPPCVVASLAGVEQDVPMVCDTLVIDSDRGLAFLVWRGQIALSQPQQKGMVFVSAARLGSRSKETVVGTVGLRSPALPFQRGGQRGGAAAMTLTAAYVPTKPALPFQPTPEDALSAEGDEDEDADEVDDRDDPPTVRRAALAKLIAGKGDTKRPQPTSSPPLVASFIEHCAAVAARLASPGADVAAELEAEGLSPEVWEKEHARWLCAIQDELDRGNSRLLQLARSQHRVTEEQLVEIVEQHRELLLAYDSAYVSALEELRGPIAVRDFVKLSRAADGGQVAPVLAALGLPEESMSRIQRVWWARMAEDPVTAAAVHAAFSKP